MYRVACGSCGLEFANRIKGTFQCPRCGTKNTPRCCRCNQVKDKLSDGILHEVAGKLYCNRCKSLFADQTADTTNLRVTIPDSSEDEWAWIAPAFATMPAAIRPRVYKALASILHPDTEHGSEEAMKALNDANDRYKNDGVS